MGRLAGIARRAGHRAPMEELEAVAVSCEHGVEGDARGAPGRRQVTVLAREGWLAALAGLAGGSGSAPGWTARRANLLVEGVALAARAGARLRVGEVVLLVTGETKPCDRMEEACAGLKQALAPDWRAGVTCTVLQGGRVRLGDAVEVAEARPAEQAAAAREWG